LGQKGRASIPQTFIVTRDGYLLKRFIGFNPTARKPKMREAIEAALNK